MDQVQTRETEDQSTAVVDGGTAAVDGETRIDEKRGTEGQASSATPPHPEPKKQLRERIEARRQHLEDMLQHLQGSSVAPKERVLALQIALQGLDSHLSGGWECIGEVESAHLARWLESTQLLDEAGQSEGTDAGPAQLSMAVTPVTSDVAPPVISEDARPSPVLQPS